MQQLNKVSTLEVVALVRGTRTRQSAMGLSKNFSFWTISLDLDAMFKIKSLLYKDLILNSWGCRKSNQLLRHPMGIHYRLRTAVVIAGAIFWLEPKFAIKQCTRMYIV